MKYGIAVFLSIWPFTFLKEFGFFMVFMVIANFWIGVAVGEFIQKQEEKK